MLWNNAGTGAKGANAPHRTSSRLSASIASQRCFLSNCSCRNYAPAPLPLQKWTSSGLAEAESPPNRIDGEVSGKTTDKPMQNYEASKAGTWFISREFARHYKKDGIVSVCLNPGYLKTVSFDGTPALVMFIMNRVMLSESIFGAYTELFAGLSPEVTLENSGAYHPLGTNSSNHRHRAVGSDRSGRLQGRRRFGLWGMGKSFGTGARNSGLLLLEDGAGISRMSLGGDQGERLFL